MKKIKNLLKDIKKCLVKTVLSIKNKNIVFPIAIIFTAIFLSLPVLAQPMITEGDAYDRVFDAYRLYKSNKIYESFGGTWLPVHKSILAISLYFHDNYHLTPRIATVVINGIAAYVLYKLTLIIFENDKNKKLISNLTLILYLIFPQRIFISTQTLTEPIAAFFILSTIYFLVKNQLFKSTIFLYIAQGIRYEAWFLVPFFILYLILNDKKNKILVISSYFIFPIYWFLENLKKSGSGLEFFSEKYSVAQNAGFVKEYWNFPLSLMSWANNAYYLLGLTGSLLMIYGIFCFVKNKEKNKTGIFVLSTGLYLFSILVFQVFVGTMEWFPHRYLFLPLTILFPFFGYGLALFIKKINNLPLTLSLAPLVFIDIFYTYQVMHTISAPDLRYPTDKVSSLEELNSFYQNSIKDTNLKTLYVFNINNNYWLFPQFVYFNKLNINKEDLWVTEDKNLEIYLQESKLENTYIIIEKPAISFVEIVSENQKVFSNDLFVVYNYKNSLK